MMFFWENVSGPNRISGTVYIVNKIEICNKKEIVIKISFYVLVGLRLHMIILNAVISTHFRSPVVSVYALHAPTSGFDWEIIWNYHVLPT